MMFGLLGSNVIAPTERETCLSVRGSQCAPLSVDFQPPPRAPPRYMMLGDVGWMSMALTRPETTGSVYGVRVGRGPIDFHFGATAATPLVVSEARIASNCASALRRAPAAMDASG